MRRTLIALLLAAIALDASAARRRVSRPPVIDELKITFLTPHGNSQAGVLDAGTISFASDGQPGRRATVITRSFEVRIDRSSGERHGTATLRAFLENTDSRHVYRLDGRTLGTAPAIVDARAPIGVARRHRLEIIVPADSPDGPLFTSIRWELTTD